MRFLPRLLALVCLGTVLLGPVNSWAGFRKLWGGLVTFNVPRQSEVVADNSLENWDKAFLVTLRQKNKQVGAVIVRETLAPEQAKLTTPELAELLKAQFAGDNLVVSKWKLNEKKQQVTGSLSGKASVPWSQKRMKAVGSFRVIRVYQNEVVGVLAFGVPSEFGKAYARPFRQIVSTFKTPKPKPNKAR